MSDIRPTATAWERTVFKLERRTNTEIPVAVETVRQGICAEHKKTSQVYVGQNKKGWIFRCPGADVAAQTMFEELPTLPARREPHYFTNTPPPRSKEGEAMT